MDFVFEQTNPSYVFVTPGYAEGRRQRQAESEKTTTAATTKDRRNNVER